MGINTAKKILKIQMLKKSISAEDLQKLLKSKGYIYTVASINSKISRGAFSATFLIECMEAMGYMNINLTDLLDNEESNK